MKCSYCKKEGLITREHIISDGILELFPECDLTIDNRKSKYYKADPVIKDVCADCNNNKLTYIDSYAKSIVEKYFINKYKKDDIINFEYDFTMIEKMLLKYSFNAMRADKEDISLFTDEVVQYLLNQENEILNKKVTVLVGLKVNTSPMPDFWLNNMKLSWVKSPVFFSAPMMNGFMTHSDNRYKTVLSSMQVFDELDLSYMFNFNSGIFIILVWSDDLSETDFQTRNQFLEAIYPYSLLRRDENYCKLQRCTHAYNWFKPELVDCSSGISLIDQMNAGMSHEIDLIKTQNTLSKGWDAHEKEIRENALERKKAIQNKKNQKKLL